MTGTASRYADMLRLIALRLHLPELRTVVRQPGVNEAYRITIQYHDARHPDQVATLVRAGQDAAGTGSILTVAYRRNRHHPAFEYPLPVERFREFDMTMRRLGFDRRDDQPDVPFSGVDLWLIERASGSYFHDIVLAPSLADGVYGWMVETVREQLPQAVRAIQPD